MFTPLSDEIINRAGSTTVGDRDATEMVEQPFDSAVQRSDISPETSLL